MRFTDASRAASREDRRGRSVAFCVVGTGPQGVNEVEGCVHPLKGCGHGDRIERVCRDHLVSVASHPRREPLRRTRRNADRIARPLQGAHQVRADVACRAGDKHQAVGLAVGRHAPRSPLPGERVPEQRQCPSVSLAFSHRLCREPLGAERLPQPIVAALLDPLDTRRSAGRGVEDAVIARVRVPHEIRAVRGLGQCRKHRAPGP